MRCPTGTIFVTVSKVLNRIIHNENTELMKKIIGLGVVTGVVIFAYLQSFNNKLNKRVLDEGKKEGAQLV